MPRSRRPPERSTTTMIVRILRNECCGNAECVALAPDVFALDSKNKAIVLDPEAVEPQVLIDTAEACPCGAILVDDDQGNPVFP